MAIYNRAAVGERIRAQRMIIGWTQEELAQKIGRAYKYCQDIERGACGMSIDTMLSISASLNMSLDYLIYGDKKTDDDTLQVKQNAVIDIFGQCSSYKRDYALDLLKLFVTACDSR